MSLQGTRVFCIEDDLKNRMIVQTILEVHGAVVDYEQWGFPEIALRKMLRFRPNFSESRKLKFNPKRPLFGANLTPRT